MGDEADDPRPLGHGLALASERQGVGSSGFEARDKTKTTDPSSLNEFGLLLLLLRVPGVELERRGLCSFNRAAADIPHLRPAGTPPRGES